MPRLLTAVHTRDDIGGYGPDYALIEIEADDQERLRNLIAATKVLAEQFGWSEYPLSLGALWSTERSLFATCVKVTWLDYGSLLDTEGDEVEWLNMEDNVCVVPDDWQPNLGEPEGFDGCPNEFTSVDLELLRVWPDGDIEVEAHVDGTASIFATQDFNVSLLLGE